MSRLATPPSAGADRPGLHQSEARWATALRLLPVAVALAATAVTAVYHLPWIVRFWGEMLRWPYPMQGSESLVVWEAGKLARGESIYDHNGPDTHAFLSGPYTPLYFAAVAVTLKLTSTVYTGGRLVTLASWLFLLGLLALLVRATAPRRTAWIGAAVACVSLAVFTPGFIWAVRVKPTIPALALAAAGLLIVQRGWSSPRHAYLWAALPFVAAYFTKQTTLAAGVAAVLFLLVRAGWRAAVRFVAVGGIAGAIPLAILSLATQGELVHHVILDRRLAWKAQLVWNFGALFLRDYWPLLAAAAIAAVVLALARVPSIAPYYLLCALAFVPTIGIEGADHDHLIELAFAASLAVGAGLAVALDRTPRLAPLAWPLAALLVAQVVTGWTPDRWYAGELAAPDPQVRRQLDLIVTNVRNTPGDILAEEIGLILLADKPVPYDDPQAMAALARVGRWDQRQLIDDLNNRRFSLILLPANPRDELWTPEVLAAIHANYDLKFRDVWFTYQAKGLR